MDCSRIMAGLDAIEAVLAGPESHLMRTRARRMLEFGPWFWPGADSARQRLCTLLGLVEPPTDCVPLLTYDLASQSGGLYALRWQDGLPLLPRAQQAWLDARAAVPHALTVMLTALDLVIPANVGVRDDGSPLVDGPSFGLAFALAIAARLLEQPFPDDIVATGCINGTGQVTRVDGVGAKLGLVAHHARHVRIALVPKDNREEANEALARFATDLRVVEVSTVAEAISKVWGDATLFLACGDLANAQQRAKRLFDFTVDSSPERTVEWLPLANCADVVLRQWKDLLSPEDRSRLEIARQIAFRHAAEPVSYVPPHPALLDALPRQRRLEISAHIVQSAADFGEPSAEHARLLAGDRPNPQDAFEPDLKLAGALARLDAVTGEAERALTQAIALVKAWLALGKAGGASYALSLAYRLAGALERHPAFDELESCTRELQLGQMGISGHFISVARLVAMQHLDRLDGNAQQELERSASDCRVPTHLRLIALRALTRWSRSQSSAASAPATQAIASWTGLRETTERRLQALLALEAAVDAGQSGEPELAAFRALRAQPTGLLIEAAQRLGEPAPGYVARFWPY